MARSPAREDCNEPGHDAPLISVHAPPTSMCRHRLRLAERDADKAKHQQRSEPERYGGLDLPLFVKAEDLGEAGSDLRRTPSAVVADLQTAALYVLQQLPPL
jgi:hypothetical protein